MKVIPCPGSCDGATPPAAAEVVESRRFRRTDTRRDRGWAKSSAVSWVAVFTALVCVRASAQAPINHAFDNRLPLGRVTESVTATNSLATAEPNEPGHRGSPAVRSLWWRWTAPLDGYVVVTTTNSLVHTRVAIYDYKKVLAQLSPEPLLTNSGIPLNLNRYEFDASQSLDYNVAVDGQGGLCRQIQQPRSGCLGRSVVRPNLWRPAQRPRQ
jgi:hypothetical protein